MNLLTIKKKFIRNLTILTLGIAAFTLLIFQLFFPEHYFVCYPFIPLYFYLWGLIIGYVYVFVYNNFDEKKILPAFLIFKGIKFILSLTVVVICGLVARQHIVSLGLIFAIYYLVYLILETYFFFRLESEIK